MEGLIRRFLDFFFRKLWTVGLIGMREGFFFSSLVSVIGERESLKKKKSGSLTLFFFWLRKWVFTL